MAAILNFSLNNTCVDVVAFTQGNTVSHCTHPVKLYLGINEHYKSYMYMYMH